MELQKQSKEIPFNSISSYEEKSPTLDPSQKLNNNNNNNCHSQDPSPSPTLSPGPSPRKEMIRYRECQRNHAAHLGSHVMDGCGEFMPAGEEGTLLALKCAACDCHRNFHRREVEGDTTTAAAAAAIATTNSAVVAPIMPLSTPPNNMTTTTTTTNCYISFSKYRKNNLLPIRPSNNDTQFPMMNTTAPAPAPTPTGAIHRAPVMMAFGGGGAAAESSSEDLNAYRTGEFDCGGQYIEQYGVSKKRYRTKFSQEQKDKMMAFAEKIGWRMQKQDDAQLQRFCHDVGVKRQVFKVWMHNNKQAFKKKQA